MAELASAHVRDEIQSILAARGLPPAGEHEPLFSSGLLDSLAAAEVLMLLEADCGIDLADEDFDILQIDTLHELERLISSREADSTITGRSA